MYRETMSRNARRGVVIAVALVSVWTSVATPATAERFRPSRVPGSFYGVNFSPTRDMSVGDQQRHFEKMRAEGITNVRIDVAWSEFEHDAPENSVHQYKWDRIDPIMEAVARSGLRPSVTISQAPRWAQTDDVIERLQCSESYVRTRRPVDLIAYGEAAGAVARRYGRGGGFWEGKDFRARPIVRYHIWNEPNIYPNWCPRPDPVAYANMFTAAHAEIKAEDPLGRVVVGSLPVIAPNTPPAYLMPGDFLAGVMYTQPNLPALADGIGVNAFWLQAGEAAMERVAIFREELRDGGIPDSEPMLIAEVGWNTNGPGAFTEEERARRLRIFSRQLPRTNCNVPAMNAHTWVTAREDPSTSEDWFGLVDPLTTDLFPVAESYIKSILTFRGRTPKRAPRKTIYTCSGMPAPDRDGDGVNDEDDRYPLKPNKS